MVTRHDKCVARIALLVDVRPIGEACANYLGDAERLISISLS